MDLGYLVNGRGELGEAVTAEQRAVHVEQHRRGGSAVPGAEPAVAPMEGGSRRGPPAPDAGRMKQDRKRAVAVADCVRIWGERERN